MIINANLIRKESEFRTKSCVVEKAIAVSHAEFDDLKRHPLRDNELIAENVELMYCDRDDNYHCLLIYDEEQGDGLLIESEGTSYARYCQAVRLRARHLSIYVQIGLSERGSLQYAIMRYRRRIISCFNCGLSRGTTCDVFCNGKRRDSHKSILQKSYRY